MLLATLRAQLEVLSAASPCRLLIGFSGGMDSTVLLHAVSSVAQPLSHSVEAIHVNHGLSPNALDWENHCRAVASQMQIRLTAVRPKVEINSAAGPEGAARAARYAAFDACEADFVLLAHHANDQAETVLFNILRGCGILGLAGQPRVRGRYVRPFLDVSHDELFAYATRNNLRWCTDESNDNERFSRNFLRHDVFPLLQTRFPAAPKMLANLAGHASTTQDLLNDLGRIDLGERGDSYFPLPRSRLEGLSCERTANALRVALHAEGLQPPSAKKLDEFVRQLQEAALDRHPELRTAAWLIQVRRGKIELIKS
jgi:tRNA(Ile)-lysidine synthase